MIDENFSDYPDHDGEIFNNYVDIRSKPDAEYGQNYATTALRLRTFYDVGMYNVHVHDNTFIARTGSGEAWGCIGLKPSIGGPDNNAVSNLNILIENNMIKSIFETTDSNCYGAAVSMEGNAAGEEITFKNNIMESNLVSLGLGGHDVPDNYDGIFISNTLLKSSEGVALTYHSVSLGYWNGIMHNVSIFDPKYQEAPRRLFIGTLLHSK